MYPLLLLIIFTNPEANMVLLVTVSMQNYSEKKNKWIFLYPMWWMMPINSPHCWGKHSSKHDPSANFKIFIAFNWVSRSWLSFTISLSFTKITIGLGLRGLNYFAVSSLNHFWKNCHPFTLKKGNPDKPRLYITGKWGISPNV